MRLLFIILLTSLSLVGKSQSVPVVDLNQLEKRFTTSGDSVLVINFWATWCKPCIKELPDFLKLNEELEKEAFKLILVSLDFSTQIENRVLPFIEKNNIRAEVILLDDPDANTWINKVNPTWDGSIPATLIINEKEQSFYGQELNYYELKQFVNQKMK